MEVALAKPQVALGAVELVPRPQSLRAMLLVAMEYVGYVIVIGIDWPLRSLQHVDRAIFDNHNRQKLLPAYGALTGNKGWLVPAGTLHEKIEPLSTSLHQIVIYRGIGYPLQVHPPYGEERCGRARRARRSIPC